MIKFEFQNGNKDVLYGVYARNFLGFLYNNHFKEFDYDFENEIYKMDESEYDWWIDAFNKYEECNQKMDMIRNDRPDIYEELEAELMTFDQSDLDEYLKSYKKLVKGIL